MTKAFDIVLFGATGYTGRLVAEHLARHAPADLRWALAGRDAARLQAVHRELQLPDSVACLTADAADAAALQVLMDRTRLVITTVGPYQLYGSGLVAACARAGVDYVDLCGEPAWMREMIEHHEAPARSSGARIVFSCGFDSIPFDLGVWRLQVQMHQRHGRPASQVHGRVLRMKGTFSGGTAASLRATVAAARSDPTVMALLRDPFALTPGFQGPAQPPSHKPRHDDALDTWLAPFVMADINTRNVHRSNLLLGHAYGTDFRYDEMLVTGPGDSGRARAEAVAADRSLGADGGPRPGEGPTREERESGSYELLFVGRDDAGHEAQVHVTGDRDPGYGSTSKMVAEAALCLLGRDAQATPGGIWTPAAAMGQALIDRLQARAGLTFQTASA